MQSCCFFQMKKDRPNCHYLFNLINHHFLSLTFNSNFENVTNIICKSVKFNYSLPEIGDSLTGSGLPCQFKSRAFYIIYYFVYLSNPNNFPALLHVLESWAKHLLYFNLTVPGSLNNRATDGHTEICEYVILYYTFRIGLLAHFKCIREKTFFFFTLLHYLFWKWHTWKCNKHPTTRYGIIGNVITISDKTFYLLNGQVITLLSFITFLIKLSANATAFPGVIIFFEEIILLYTLSLSATRLTECNTSLNVLLFQQCK